MQKIDRQYFNTKETEVGPFQKALQKVGGCLFFVVGKRGEVSKSGRKIMRELAIAGGHVLFQKGHAKTSKSAYAVMKRKFTRRVGCQILKSKAQALLEASALSAPSKSGAIANWEASSVLGRVQRRLCPAAVDGYFWMSEFARFPGERFTGRG